MKNLTFLTLLAGSMALSNPMTMYANNPDSMNQEGEHRAGHHKPLKIAVWGDEFYNPDPAGKAAQIEQTLNSMNTHNLDFTLFAGDTKNGNSECTDHAIGQDVIDIFNKLKVPTLYTLGDNEWTDCHRTNNGRYNPLKRLEYLRTTFFNKTTTQGKHPIPVVRQGPLGGPYSENSRFVKSDVMFVALHIPGSNNNLVATDKQCTNKSNRTPADCAAATAEYQARNIQNIAWLQDSFTNARNHNYAGIVILMQADIYFPFELSDGGYQDDFLPQLDANNGYTDFFKTLVSETHNFSGQVLLVHGESHYYKVDKAMFNADGTVTRNFTRVEVFGSLENSWIEMTVDPSTENVFSFQPVILGQ